MKLPRSVIVNGERWRVVLKPLAGRGFHGRCNYRRREIQIDRELPASERGEVFLHELMHANLPEHWSRKVEERLVLRLAPRLLDALRGLGWAP